MSNPNNCETCKHKQTPQGGFCYMFADAPTEVCYQHTHRKEQEGILMDLLHRLYQRGDNRR